MSGKLEKKIRKATKKGWLEFYVYIKNLPFYQRWQIAWYILFGSKKLIG